MELSHAHRAYLNSAAIDDEVIDAAGVWTASDAGELPLEFRANEGATTPAIVLTCSNVARGNRFP